MEFISSDSSQKKYKYVVVQWLDENKVKDVFSIEDISNIINYDKMNLILEYTYLCWYQANICYPIVLKYMSKKSFE